MLWMGICSPHHAVTTTLVRPDLVRQLISLITAGILSCISWGSKPMWNCTHISSKHIKSDWQHSYAVDGDMEPPLCCYHHTCGTWFGKSAEIMDHFWVPNDTIMHWLMLLTHMVESGRQTLYAVDGEMEPPSYAVTTTLSPVLESQLILLITSGCQMIPSCIGWRSTPTWMVRPSTPNT